MKWSISSAACRGLATITALALAASQPALAGFPGEPPVEVRMAHVSIVETGAGPPVVLIPGLSTPREVWTQVAADLADSHRLVLVQVNGFAGDDPGANLEAGILDGIVADLASHLGHAGHERVAIVGHSMGGLVGMLFASRHPTHVDRLMVVDALPYFAVQLVPPGSDITVAEAEPTARRMRDAVARTHGQSPDADAVQASVAGMSLKPHNHARLATWATHADVRVVAQAMYENLTTDARPQLPAIQAPITLLYAWNAQGPGQERVEAFFHRQFANAEGLRTIGIADAGHFIMLDQPDAFGEALHAFLAGTQ